VYWVGQTTLDGFVGQVKNKFLAEAQRARRTSMVVFSVVSVAP
jgi:hypothetical protein